MQLGVLHYSKHCASLLSHVVWQNTKGGNEAVLAERVDF